MKGFVVSSVLVCAVGLACGPMADDDDGASGSASEGSGSLSASSSATESATTEAATTDASATGSGSTDPDGSESGMVGCGSLTAEECQDAAQCESVRGTEALPDGEPGQYQCSDLALPFRCADAGCEPSSGIVCKLDEPGVARWVVDDCIPIGWEECPDSSCV